MRKYLALLVIILISTLNNCTKAGEKAVTSAIEESKDSENRLNVLFIIDCDEVFNIFHIGGFVDETGVATC